jgi:hypothetical protein
MTTMQRSERASETERGDEQSGRKTTGGCCGGPAPTAGACCARDHAVKAGGGAGCGCGTAREARTCC